MTEMKMIKMLPPNNKNMTKCRQTKKVSKMEKEWRTNNSTKACRWLMKTGTQLKWQKSSSNNCNTNNRCRCKWKWVWISATWLQSSSKRFINNSYMLNSNIKWWTDNTTQIKWTRNNISSFWPNSKLSNGTKTASTKKKANSSSNTDTNRTNLKKTPFKRRFNKSSAFVLKTKLFSVTLSSLQTNRVFIMIQLIHLSTPLTCLSSNGRDPKTSATVEVKPACLRTHRHLETSSKAF